MSNWNQIPSRLSFAVATVGLATLLSFGQDRIDPAPIKAPKETGSGASKGPSQKPNSRDALSFRNGDLLYGNLQSIDPADAILWQHPDTLQPIAFKPETVSEIQFGYREQPKFKAATPCQVRLINQDELAGDLVFGDTETIILETWYAGKIEIPRKLVQFIIPQLEEGPLRFAGPTGLEGWTMGQVTIAVPNGGEWKYKSGGFYATRSASIARDLKLPDIAKIECDITWKGMLYLAIALYTDYMHPVNLQSKETGPDFGGFYSLQLNNYTANLLPVTKNDPLRYLGQASVQAFSQKNKIHMDIRVNKPKRAIALLVDGVLVKEWIDTEEFVGKGTGMRIVHQGQGSIKLSNLRVSEWNGQFEEKPSPTPNSKEDIAKLQNGDKVVGLLQTIRDGKMTFGPTGGTALDIPLNRVKLLEMAAQRAGRADEDKVDMRATFRNGGSVSLHLEKWTEHEVVGSSPNFGKVTFNPLAFERVQFNLKLSSKPAAALPAQDFQRGKAVVRAVRGAADFYIGEPNWKKLRVGQTLPSGSTVRTGADSQVDLFLGDNGPVVRMTPGSTLGLTKLNFRRDGVETISETLLNLEKGRIWANVRKLTAGSKYEVLTAKGTLALGDGGGEVAADAEGPE